MVTNNFFDHGGSNGSTLGSRVAATGYVASALGENIAAGYGTVTNVMTGWMNSPGHCANIMNPAFTQIGVACIKGVVDEPLRRLLDDGSGSRGEDAASVDRLRDHPPPGTPRRRRARPTAPA